MIKLNYEYPARPIETFLNGVPTDADSLSYRIYRNGVAETDPASLVATSDKIADGLKFATLTTLGLTDGWATTDDVLGFVDAVISGETYSTLFFDSTYFPSDLVSAQVHVDSPLDPSTRLIIKCGDDYSDTTGQPLTFTYTGTLPSLSGATLTLTAKHAVTGTTITGTGTLVSQVGDTAVIKVTLTKTETAKGRDYPGKWEYDLQATLSGGSVRTLVGPGAPCRVVSDQTQ